MNMKKYLCGLLAVGFIAASCQETNYVDPYENVREGFIIYNSGEVMNTAAMQPADIMLRFGMLYSEAVKKNKLDEINELPLTVGTINLNVKSVLLGANTTIHTPTTPGVYVIEFNSSTATGNDAYVRMGSVTINTNSLTLEQTDINTAWTFDIASNDVTFTPTSSLSSSPTTTLKGLTSYKIYSNGGRYDIIFDGIQSSVSESTVSDYDGTFFFSVLKANEPYNSLAYSDINNNSEYISYTLTGSGSGDSFWDISQTERANLKYTASSLVFDNNKAYYSQAISGEEIVSIENTTQPYASNAVVYTWSLANNTITLTVGYNGFSESLIF